MAVHYCLIISADTTLTALLQQFVGQLPFLKTTDVVSSGGAALARLQERTYDLVLLGLTLPDLSGLDLLDALPGLKPVVAIAEEGAHAAACYDRGVVDYLQLPLTYPRFVQAINRAMLLRPPTRSVQDVFLKNGRQMMRFVLDDIDYVEAAGMASKVWIGPEQQLVSALLTELTQQLPAHQFVRVHKSYIVNLDHLTAFTQTHLSIGSTEIPIGLTYRSSLYQVLGYK
jgi:DNA-binding LytR/AlgR family response regulator